MLHKKSSGVDRNKLMLHEKLIYVKRKKVDVARKIISCLQKEDDAAQKNYFVLKKVINFFRNGAPYFKVDGNKLLKKYKKIWGKISN